ncbi:hypothetical protein FEE95_14720 [Maribacter algarum]|uniref:Uncharacterized protein n=1 Tax=Maribacter algarum (ex Zhang et al. 2020) TaxID=2578118 RepID=A0A5S3PN31_9FLAO|nr:hypothetical protein [Maribacter algarum]TMM55899.1 hypothetical protein FEE95_14720 [Maribacter algarum]
MNTKDKFYFKLLKEQITVTFLKSHNAPDSIEAWKGEEIALFQEDLFTKVKAKVSEKWFYTYFKNTPDKLPRIDMLNLLSKYVEQSNWNTFKSNHETPITQIPKTTKSKYLLFGLIPIALLVWFGFNTKNEFQFCFVENLSDNPIVKIPLDIKILSKGESPIGFKTDSLGCFTYSSADDYIKFVVKSPYHKTDTIVRFIENNKNQKIQLEADDYALMLKFYTDGNVTDWNKHKRGLRNLISDEAIIYQLHSKNIGVELFSKEDFIQLLTVPTSNLKRIKVLEKTLKNGKIVKLKFITL